MTKREQLKQQRKVAKEEMDEAEKGLAEAEKNVRRANVALHVAEGNLMYATDSVLELNKRLRETDD